MPKGNCKALRGTAKRLMALTGVVLSLFTIWTFLIVPWTGAKKTGYDYVNPLIGTINGGHVFPGATLPYGMAKAGPDVEGENQGGYSPDGSKVKGFSHMHDSGTGGVTSLGNFPLFPIANCVDGQLARCVNDHTAHAVNDSIEARPGYFKLDLVTGVRAEMTTSNRTALYRFTFPDSDDEEGGEVHVPIILAEMTDLPGSAKEVDNDFFYNKTSGRVMGRAMFDPSFGTGNYWLSFCVDYFGAEVREVGAYSYQSGARIGIEKPDGWFDDGFELRGGFTKFAPGTTEVIARVGVSFHSNERACRNAEREIPDFDFDETVATAETAWRDKLDVIQISDDRHVPEDLKTVFWSGLYRNFISPQDYTGENPLWVSNEPYYDSFYCIWDSFRAQHPLLTLMDPEEQTKMVRSLIDIYEHEGHMPDCRMSLCKGWSQGGSNADVVLADAYVKGLVDNVNWTKGYEALLADAEIEPSRWDLEGRGGLESWVSKGYIPMNDEDNLGFGPHTRSISRTVEYAYDDFSVAQVALGLNLTDDYNKYMNRSSFWKNLWKEDQHSKYLGKDVGFVGNLQPKNFDGTWNQQDPLLCSALVDPYACFLTMDGHETYEGSAWLYSFFVPGDNAALIKTMGGKEDFVRRLDYFHESGHLYMGDEQAFLTTFLYHYAGRPGLSAKRVHTYIPSQFNNTFIGIPGNDDSGAMGAYASMTMMGVFPNAGQNVYFITPPFFREVSITNPVTGNTATIRNVDFDAEYKNIYIQSAKLDGAPYPKNWIDHSFFLDGGLLELKLGPEESNWGTKEEDVPPSLSTTRPNGGIWDKRNPSKVYRGSGRASIFMSSMGRGLMVAGAVVVIVVSLYAARREYDRWRGKRVKYHKLDDDLEF